MLPRPTYLLHPRLRVRLLRDDAIEILDPDLDAVVLVSDVATALTTLVTTGHLPDDLTAEAADDLEALANAGFLLRLPPGLAPSAARRWWALRVDPADASTFCQHRVSVAALDVRAPGVAAALAAYGLVAAPWTAVDAPATVGLILADDVACVPALPYQAGPPTLIVQTNAAFPWAVWLEPGRTACPHCLHRHLQINTPTSSLALASSERPLGLAPERIAMLVAEGIARAAWTAESPSLMLLGDDRTSARHIVRRVPTCPACGIAPVEAAPTWQARPKAPGGHRWLSLGAAAEQLAKLHSPLVGVYANLPTSGGDPGSDTADTPPNPDAPAPSQRHVVVLRYRALQPVRRLDRLQRSLTLVAGGNGATHRHALVKAQGEAAERASGTWWPQRPHVCARVADLNGCAFTPSDLLGFSGEQYANRLAWNEQAHPFLRVPERFDPQEATAWVRGYALPGSPDEAATEANAVWIPAGCAFYGYDFGAEPVYAYADSNGCAAGACIEEAALCAMYELIERDSIALWTRSGAVRPSVDLRTASRSDLVEAPQRYAEQGRTLAVLDVTSDLGVPAFVALSHRLSGPRGWVLGFGCHLDPQEAVARAVGEVAHGVHEVEAGSDALAWGDTATSQAYPHLAPDPSAPARDLSTWPAHTTDDVLADLHTVVARVRRAGFTPFVIDQTHPLVGISVARVVVPGLAHFWRRLGTPRLRSAPHALGWVPTPRVLDAPNWTEVTI
ncbi:MAG: YcaO-like family protein [Bacteroidota bacterium]